MYKKSTLAVLCITALTASCGGTIIDYNGGVVDNTPVFPTNIVSAVGGAADNGDGTYTVTQGTKTVELPTTNASVNGQPQWGLSGGNYSATAYTSANVTAIGGLEGFTPFAGVSGTQTAAPTGDATFVGGYSVHRRPAIRSGPLTLNFDLESGAVTNVGGVLDVNGTIDGTGLSGTVALGEFSATLDGGFYGTDEIAGAFNGENIGGSLFGIRQ